MENNKYETIRKIIEDNRNTEQARKMSAYMHNKFVFAGITKPELKSLVAPFLKETSRTPLDWGFVSELWKCEYREAQYVALEYLQKHRKQISVDNIDELTMLITEKSWWETVDTLDALIGDLIKKDNSLKNVMKEWAVADNIWLRRVAIDFQQGYKTDTDTDLLEEIIKLNLGSTEFFINKAIGWSLRDYSKINPEWVSSFIVRNREKMSALSIKEASKYI